MSIEAGKETDLTEMKIQHKERNDEVCLERRHNPLYVPLALLSSTHVALLAINVSNVLLVKKSRIYCHVHAATYSNMNLSQVTSSSRLESWPTTHRMLANMDCASTDGRPNMHYRSECSLSLIHAGSDDYCVAKVCTPISAHVIWNVCNVSL